MKSAIAIAILAASLAAFDDVQNAEALMVESVAQFNRVAAAMENAKKVSDVRPKIEAAAVNLAELKRRSQAIKLSDEQTAELERKMKPQFQKAAARFIAAAKTLVAQDPGGAADLAEVMMKLEKSVK